MLLKENNKLKNAICIVYKILYRRVRINGCID